MLKAGRRASRAIACPSSRPISSGDAGWPEAVAGCDYVLHVASPFPADLPKHEDELIVPAREGALRVLRAARDAGVRRVVLTSSFAAIGYGHQPQAARSTKRTGRIPTADGRAALREIEDPGRTRGLGFHRPRRRRARAVRRQPGRRVRPGAGPGLFDLDPAGAAPDGRRHARLPAARLRRRRRARRRRPAPSRHDRIPPPRASASSPSRAISFRCSTSPGC